MQKKKNFLKLLTIFDGNHLMYRAYYKFSGLKTIEGNKTSVIYGCPYIMASLINKFGPNKVVVVFDGGRDSFRTTLLPSYKERPVQLGFDKEDFYRQRDELVKVLTHLGIPIIYKRGKEADDYIALTTIKYERKGWEVIIISGDKDFNQMISEKVSVWNVSSNLHLRAHNLINWVGYTPQQAVDYLCLMGDHSDNIPGYPGIGEKRAAEFLNRFTSIQNFLKGKDSYGKVEKSKLEEIYKKNKKLVDLRYYYRKFLINEKVEFYNIPKFDLGKLKKECAKHEISTFIKEDFIKTFKYLKDE